MLTHFCSNKPTNVVLFSSWNPQIENDHNEKIDSDLLLIFFEKSKNHTLFRNIESDSSLLFLPVLLFDLISERKGIQQRK
uniref:Uncharacterized protein n=1 Tax=Onchocerca volvulus TaxID=6282 RepID=A0A8R1TNY3_ONCVO